MAGDWIKMRTDLYRDPKVCLMADALLSKDSELSRYVSQNMQRDMTVTRNVMRNVTVGALVSVWGVLRHRGKRHDTDLAVKGCALSVIDDLADLPGFGNAMASVGWVEESADGLVFPRFFEEFNVDPSEEMKQKNAERQRRYREKQKEKSDVTRDVTVASQSNAREEKRREEKKKTSMSGKPDTPPPGPEQEPREHTGVLDAIEAEHTPVASLPLVDGTVYVVDDAKVAGWAPAYPAVDVPQQLVAMVAWLNANPKNRKTRSGIERFIVGWLAKQQNQAPRQQGHARETPWAGAL